MQLIRQIKRLKFSLKIKSKAVGRYNFPKTETLLQTWPFHIVLLKELGFRKSILRQITKERCLWDVYIYLNYLKNVSQNIKFFTSNKPFLHIKPYHSRFILRLSSFCCRGPAADSFSEFNLAEQLKLASVNKIRSQFSSSKPSISLGELLLLISV